MQNPTEKLTPEQLETENQIAEKRVEFLDHLLRATPEHELKRLTHRLKQAVFEALRNAQKKLQQRNINFPAAILRSGIKLELMTSECARTFHGAKNRTVAAGMANRETWTILLLNHLLLAPVDVIKGVVTHELIHLMYPGSAEPLQIRNAILQGYPKNVQQEEEWVRRMEESMLGKENLLEAWELAVEEGGNNWRELYYRIKRSKALRRYDDYASTARQWVAPDGSRWQSSQEYLYGVKNLEIEIDDEDGYWRDRAEAMDYKEEDPEADAFSPDEWAEQEGPDEDESYLRIPRSSWRGAIGE